MNKKYIISVFLVIFSSKTHGMNCLVYNHHQKIWNKTRSLENNQKALVDALMLNCINTCSASVNNETLNNTLSTISKHVYGCELMEHIISVYYEKQNTTKCSFIDKPIKSNEVTISMQVDRENKSNVLKCTDIINMQYLSGSFHVIRTNECKSELIYISFPCESNDNICTDDVILFTLMVYWWHYIENPAQTIKMCNKLDKGFIKKGTQDLIESTKRECCILAIGSAEECLAVIGYNLFSPDAYYNYINTNIYWSSKEPSYILRKSTPHIIEKVTISIDGNIQEITPDYKVEDCFFFKPPPHKRLEFGKGDYQYNKPSIWWKIGQIFTCTKGDHNE